MLDLGRQSKSSRTHKQNPESNRNRLGPLICRMSLGSQWVLNQGQMEAVSQSALDFC